MPGTDYDLAINFHICRNGVPGRARYVGDISEPDFIYLDVVGNNTHQGQNNTSQLFLHN